MIVSACMDLTQKIGGGYGAWYAFVTVRTGYCPGGPITTGEALTVHKKAFGKKLTDLMQFQKRLTTTQAE